MKKGIVFIKGGFGNQLFQLSFANYLKENGYKVFINTYLLNIQNSDTHRQLVLPLSNFNFKSQGLISKLLFYINHKLETTELVRSSFLYSYFKNFKYTKADSFSVDNKSKVIYFNDYWKDMIYADFSKDFILNSLQKNQDITDGLNKNNNKVLIHVRRTDFLLNGWNLNEDFYKKSLKILNEKLDSFDYDIFTDDKNWVKEKNIFLNAKNVFTQKNFSNKEEEKNDILKTFGRMLQYKHFIVGNSTFAFWAAFIKSDAESICIVPDPWFRNHSHPVLKKEEWITVENI